MSAPTRFSKLASNLTSGARKLSRRFVAGVPAGLPKSLPTGLIAGLLVAALLLMPVGGAALADALDDARASGAIGERFDGFLAVRDPSAPASARQLVEEINAKRRAVYSEVSAREGATLDSVGRIYAKEIVENVPPGTWVLRENGQWVQK